MRDVYVMGTCELRSSGLACYLTASTHTFQAEPGRWSPSPSCLAVQVGMGTPLAAAYIQIAVFSELQFVVSLPRTGAPSLPSLLMRLIRFVKSTGHLSTSPASTQMAGKIGRC